MSWVVALLLSYEDVGSMTKWSKISYPLCLACQLSL